jgi:hypothetical protein
MTSKKSGKKTSGRNSLFSKTSRPKVQFDAKTYKPRGSLGFESLRITSEVCIKSNSACLDDDIAIMEVFSPKSRDRFDILLPKIL